MAILDYINEIKQTMTGQLNQQKLSNVNLKLNALSAEADALLKSHEAVKEQSKGRKSMIGQLSNKILQYQDLQTKLSATNAELQKLSQYRKKAIEQKQDYNNRIKTLFDIKLTNQTAKDYNTYKKLYSEFDFEHVDDEVTLDKNKRTYELLELAGTFGNDKLSDVKTLPNPKGTDKKVETNNWRTKLKQQ